MCPRNVCGTKLSNSSSLRVLLLRRRWSLEFSFVTRNISKQNPGPMGQGHIHPATNPSVDSMMSDLNSSAASLKTDGLDSQGSGLQTYPGA